MAVCLIMITIELGVLIAAALIVALRVKDAAQAVEVMAYRVETEVENVGSTLRSGWVRTLGGLASVVTGAWTGRNRG